MSAFAQSKVLHFIRNMNGEFFEKSNLEHADEKKISRKIKQCFKYVQSELKKQYKMYFKIEKEEKENRYMFTE